VKIFSRLLVALLAVAFSTTAGAKGGHGGHGGKGHGSAKHASARGHGGGWSARAQRDADPGPETPNVELDPPARPAPRR